MIYLNSKNDHPISTIVNHHYLVRNEHVTSQQGTFDSFSILRRSHGTTKSNNIYVPSLTLPVRYGITSDVNGPLVFPTFQPLQPSLPLSVQISLTIVYIVVFSLIFILIYAQLWMIWYYRHKRLSYQTLFLFMCLIWAGLRISLFSFYFKNCLEANELNTALYWLLYSLPVCLQFSMLCLLLHFFSQVVLKAKSNYEQHRYKHTLHLFIGLSVLVFTAVNLACAIATRQSELQYASIPLYLIYIRVTLSETMFFVYGVLLSISIFKMTKMASIKRVLEAKGTTVRKAVVVTILITFLFLSRTIYNLVSICFATKRAPDFGFDWINVTDQADSVSKLPGSLAYVSFGVVLFVWEVLPVSIVVIFFRVKRLSAGQLFTDFTTQRSGPRVFFFDNQQRYDSDGDLLSQYTTDQFDVSSPQSYSSQSLATGRTPDSSSLCAIATAPSPQINASIAPSAIMRRFDVSSPQSYSSQSLATGRTPDSSSLCAIATAPSPQINASIAPSSVSNPVLSNKQDIDYGAIGGEGFTQTMTNPSYSAASK